MKRVVAVTIKIDILAPSDIVDDWDEGTPQEQAYEKIRDRMELAIQSNLPEGWDYRVTED